MRLDITRRWETQKTQNSSFAEGPLVAISDQLLCYQPSWILAITRNHKNDCIKDRDSQ